MGRDTVLVIEDEADLREVLAYNLKREGYRVVTSGSGTDGLRRVRDVRPSMVLLDLMLPDLDGVEICKAIRSDPDARRTAIIMVTARGGESDVVLGLGVGADDYVTKPFSPKELIARMKAVLRRRSARAEEEEDATRILERRDDHGVVWIDPVRHEVRVDHEPVYFTATEFRLLRFLAARPGRVYSRDQLLRAATGDGTVLVERNIDVHVRAIRKKLGIHRELIETIRGVGYRFRDASE